MEIAQLLLKGKRKAKRLCHLGLMIGGGEQEAGCVCEVSVETL
jgi:hypothetical protein